MKFILVPCAVFLTMAMSPVDPSSDPTRRPDVRAVRERASDCHWMATSAGSSNLCAITQNRELDELLDAYVADLAKRLDPVAAEQLRRDQRAWDARRNHQSARGRRATDDPTARLIQRYSGTLDRFRWLAAHVAATLRSGGPAAGAEVVNQAKLAPAPAFVTPPNPAPVVAVPAVEPTPPAAPTPAPRIRDILAEARANKQLIPVDTWPEGVDPRNRRELVKAQLLFSACMQDVPNAPRPIQRRTVCQSDLRQNVTGVLDAFVAEQLAKLSEARRKRAQEEQRQWQTQRQSSCEIEARSFVSAAMELDSTRCWIKTTRDRFAWAAALTKAP